MEKRNSVCSSFKELTVKTTLWHDYQSLVALQISEEMNAEKGLMELLLQVTYHANQLPVLINEAMNVTEEGRCCCCLKP
ncbi:hypothetical protein MRX96_052095 [Rhipicephalus microplus]